MTFDELDKILSRGEDLHHEFKKADGKVPLSFYDTVVAFLNREGGTIVLGADDAGNITGINPSAVEQMKKDVITALNNKDVINPPVNFPVYQLIGNGKTVLCVKIPVSSQIHNHSGVIFDRENDSDIRIEDNARISELYFRKRSHFTENEIYPYLFLDDLDEKLFDKTRAFIRSVNPAHSWLSASNMDILRSCGFYQKDIHSGKEGLTLAAALVFGKDLTIQNTVPAYKFDILVRIKDLDRYDDKLTLRTNLIDTYIQAMDFLKTRAYLPDKFYLEGDLRKDLRELIFREVVANVIVHREYTSAFPTTIAVYNNRVEVSNPNKTLFRGVLSLNTFNPYAKNPNIRKFFSEFRWADEIGSGVKNVYKYLWLYAQSRPVFKEDDLFRTKISLVSTILGKEKAAAFMELVGLDKFRLNDETISAIESLELAPEYMEIEDFDELFFKKGSCWSEKGSMLKKLRLLINNNLQIDDFKKGSCWAEKGVMLFDKRTATIFRFLLICLVPQKRDDIFEIMEIRSRDKFRELYMNFLRDEGFIEYTVKDKPKSTNQRYITTEKGKRFLGGFEL
ncbi:MAG: putative DNA binding domain-containing protein [Dysgonamonadaceae bacterium]|jgi:predicted HTH transcriptional regulator|nr:putative DNA binding domain-containing protein [Dysgonamonadaceae bacterium]